MLGSENNLRRTNFLAFQFILTPFFYWSFTYPISPLVTWLKTFHALVFYFDTLIRYNLYFTSDIIHIPYCIARARATEASRFSLFWRCNYQDIERCLCKFLHVLLSSVYRLCVSPSWSVLTWNSLIRIQKSFSSYLRVEHENNNCNPSLVWILPSCS